MDSGVRPRGALLALSFLLLFSQCLEQRGSDFGDLREDGFPVQRLDDHERAARRRAGHLLLVNERGETGVFGESSHGITLAGGSTGTPMLFFMRF